ncbi:MAG: hypothetical protein KUG75_07385, partial [Pseudomonadales bacterium]|nr:hypothetical protein [Pseudomonadales bacterium]
MSKKGSDECRYVVFASFSELPAGEWDKLLACSDSNSVFLTLGWLSSWEQSYGKNAVLIIVLAYGAGDLIAAAAFENKSGELIFAGLGPSDYSDFIFRNDLEESFITRVLSQLLTEASRVAIKF